MKKSNNLENIENSITGKPYILAGISQNDGFELKKIFAGENTARERAKQNFPETEIVEDVQSIIIDSAIDLVLVSEPSSNDLKLVSAILKSGKNVRVV
jgi:predicted dehydrogenase